MRRIACFMLSLLIITGVPVSACAAQASGGIETQSLYTARPTVNISISEAGIATFYLTCRGKSDVTKIKAKTCIEKKSGTRWVKVNVGTSDNIYRAQLELVSTSWLYTNYYFHCSDSGKFLLEGMVYSDTGRPTPMKIGVYSLTTKRFVDTYTVESSLKGTYFTHSFNGLYKSSKYAIAFVAVYDGFSHDSVHGWCYIK